MRPLAGRTCGPKQFAQLDFGTFRADVLVMKYSVRPSKKWQFLLVWSLLSVSYVALAAEIIPPSRRAPWQGNVGIIGGIPKVANIFTTLNSVTSGSQIQAALEA